MKFFLRKLFSLDAGIILIVGVNSNAIDVLLRIVVDGVPIRAEEFGRVLSWLAWCWDGQMFRGDIVGDRGDFAEDGAASWRSLLDWGGDSGSVLDQFSGPLLILEELELRKKVFALFCVGILECPLSNSVVLQMHPMLLWPNDHTWPHESHVGNAGISRKAVAVDKIGTDETASSAKSSFAVDCYLLLVCNHLVANIDKLPDGFIIWASSIVKDHVDMSNTHLDKVLGRIEVRVQSYNHTNVLGVEVLENITEALRELGASKFLKISGVLATFGLVPSKELVGVL